jgi:hypothetical protein
MARPEPLSLTTETLETQKKIFGHFHREEHFGMFSGEGEVL